MRGVVVDASSKDRLQYVQIHNYHTGERIQSNKDGTFSIRAKDGDLVSFSLLGYKESSIRISKKLASYYNVGLILGPLELSDVTVYDRSVMHKIDSIRNATVFQQAIKHYRLEGSDVIMHPLSALSIDNRRIWAFQKRYAATERLKFIEASFNETLIYQLTKLNKDSIAAYRKAYMPSFEMLTTWNEYEYYSYIKQTAKHFRSQSSKN